MGSFSVGRYTSSSGQPPEPLQRKHCMGDVLRRWDIHKCIVMLNRSNFSRGSYLESFVYFPIYVRAWLGSPRIKSPRISGSRLYSTAMVCAGAHFEGREHLLVDARPGCAALV